MTLSRAALACLWIVLCLYPADCRPAPPPDPDARHLVGAYYYSWYPGNWQSGYLRGRLDPPQAPVLGVYRSDDPEVARRHIAWCSRYGIDFLALDWWPRRKWLNEPIEKTLLRSENLGDIRFCIFFETQDLLFRRCPGAEIFHDQVVRDSFLTEALEVAGKFFGHPRYLKVDGRPVMILYLTRTYSGLYAEALSEFRARCRRLGWDPYIIGDEVFWQVASTERARALGLMGERGGDCPPASDRPQPERIGCFDAITAYNMYESGARAQAGYGADSRFIGEVEALWRRYRAAAGPEVAFVPDLIPGFNDRGTRLGSGHYALPRRGRAGAPEGSFLEDSFRRLGWPFLDPRLNMLMLTSFNEWNEDTSIEPLTPAPPTDRDASQSGHAYTQGYAYQGYGERFLEIVRDQVAAAAGRVTGPDGRGAAGAVVGAWRNGALLARARCDAAGYFTLSRRNLPPGEYQVGLEEGGPRRAVGMTAERAALVDLAAPGRPR